MENVDSATPLSNSAPLCYKLCFAVNTKLSAKETTVVPRSLHEDSVVAGDEGSG